MSRALFTNRSPERGAHCAPGALSVRSLFRAERDGTLPSTGTVRLPGGEKNSGVRKEEKSTWSGAPSATRREGRRENRKEGGRTRENVLRETLFKKKKEKEKGKADPEQRICVPRVLHLTVLTYKRLKPVNLV